MVFSGYSADGWRSGRYDAVEVLQDLNKGLVRRLPGDDVLAIAGRDGQSSTVDMRCAVTDQHDVTAFLQERGFALERGAGEDGEVWYLRSLGSRGTRVGPGFPSPDDAMAAVAVGDRWLADARGFLDGDLGRGGAGGSSPARGPGR